ncbi:MAG: DUF695 domain-containing protein [Flavobacteriales bacterium]
MESHENFKGIIGKYEEDGFPIIVRFVNEIPHDSVISSMPWFTVISWKYDGATRNGMPPELINIKMIELEKALESVFWKNNICRHAYNRTGNNLKEFNYYITNRDEFMSQFNRVLKDHNPYPIEIVFYQDPEWNELHEIIDDFTK